MASNKKHQSPSSSWDIERFNPIDSPWYSRKLLNEHLARYNLAGKYVKGKIVVELGCGLGYGTKTIVQKGAKKVYGIDIDIKAIEFAKKNYSHHLITYINRSATVTMLSKSTADVVIAFEILEHVPNPEELISESMRILKPGGILILSTPNRDTSLRDNPFHLKEFTFSDLNLLLNGFKKREFFGQGKVLVHLIRFYQYLILRVRYSFFKRFFYFRPWEGYRIYPLLKKSKSNCVYFIVICQKS